MSTETVDANYSANDAKRHSFNSAFMGTILFIGAFILSNSSSLSQSNIGQWTISQHTDPLTREKSVGIQNASGAFTIGNRQYSNAALLIDCDKNRDYLEFLHFPSFVTVGRINVRYTLDGGNVRSMVGTNVGAGKSFQLADMELTFVKDLESAKTLRMQIVLPEDYSQGVITFNVSNTKNALTKLVCRKN
jgi:hypothetical protein